MTNLIHHLSQEVHLFFSETLSDTQKIFQDKTLTTGERAELVGEVAFRAFCVLVIALTIPVGVALSALLVVSLGPIGLVPAAGILIWTGVVEGMSFFICVSLHLDRKTAD